MLPEGKLRPLPVVVALSFPPRGDAAATAAAAVVVVAVDGEPGVSSDTVGDAAMVVNALRGLGATGSPS